MNLYDNRFESVSSRIGNLKNLEILNLGKNKLESLPEEIFDLYNLKTLLLGNNGLSALRANRKAAKRSISCVYEEYVKIMGIKDCKECYANCNFGDKDVK